MIISQSLYQILLPVFFIGLTLILARIGKGKFNTEKKKMIYVVAVIVLLFSLNNIRARVFSRIYTITNCGEYKREVLLFPTKLPSGVKLRLGKHLYIDNQSGRTLHFETLKYGDPLFETDIDLDIQPQSFVTVPAININYIFETPPESISSNSFGQAKQYLYCK